MIIAPLMLALAVPQADTQPDIIPATLHGVWAEQAESCADEDGESKMLIDGREITWFEGGMRVSQARRMRAGTVEVKGVMWGVDTPDRVVRRHLVLAGGKLRFTDPAEPGSGPTAQVRCS